MKYELLHDPDGSPHVHTWEVWLILSKYSKRSGLRPSPTSLVRCSTFGCVAKRRVKNIDGMTRRGWARLASEGGSG